MSTATTAKQKLLPVPGFGTLNAICGPGIGQNDAFAEVTFQAGSHTMDKFITSILGNSSVSVGSTVLTPPGENWLFGDVSEKGVTSVWERQILRYTTGSGGSATTHIATLDIMVSVGGTNCDFDATASIEPGVKGP